MDLDFYSAPGPLTRLSTEQTEMIRQLDLDAPGLCQVAQRLLISPPDAAAAGLPEQRMVDRNTRPAAALLQRALELDGTTSLSKPRSTDRRVVGTCRHYAALTTAFLRATDVPARARCGFATYFVPPKVVDHWIVEHWSNDERRWIRIDPEYIYLETPHPSRPHDLRPGEFLTAGESWQLVRSGDADPTNFGVFGTQNWGPGEVRGNAMRDIASIVAKVEMLPWDVWGPMEDSYNGQTGDEFDELIDDYATAAREHDASNLQRIYDERLAVPEHMIG